jgi:hypothetical protein
MVKVSAGDGTAVEAQARQTAPGHYEARVVANARQPLTVSVAGADAAATTRLIFPDVAAEYRFRPANEALLRGVAQATGGTWKPDAAALTNSSGAHRTARRALWPGLVVAALLLWMVDVLLRRVRLFEQVTA